MYDFAEAYDLSAANILSAQVLDPLELQSYFNQILKPYDHLTPWTPGPGASVIISKNGRIEDDEFCLLFEKEQSLKMIL